MSLLLTLCPLVVALSATATTSSLGMLLNRQPVSESDLPAVPTKFADASTLMQTLREHGLHVGINSENDLVVKSEAGVLHYFRNAQDEPFQVEAHGVRDIGALVDSLDELENEYGRNVQKFTYDHVLRSLEEHGMQLDSEEILEDDTILLTINI